jgi:hypothetical protein
MKEAELRCGARNILENTLRAGSGQMVPRAGPCVPVAQASVKGLWLDPMDEFALYVASYLRSVTGTLREGKSLR